LTIGKATDVLRIIVWNEGEHERRGTPQTLSEHYPSGIGGAIADALWDWIPDAEIRHATLTDPEHGLSEDTLASADVLLWWAHIAHDDVNDAIVERVKSHVLGGMGLIVLHSGHYSKIFRSLMGSTCSLLWRNAGERELIWTTSPAHPIAEGIASPVVIPHQETYGELFDVPQPDELVFLSSFAGGEVFRSGITYTRGLGRIFYFSPGDQEYPVYNQPEVQHVLANAAGWVAQPHRRGHRAPTLRHIGSSWFGADPSRAEDRSRPNDVRRRG
jgi:trehalose utilization protein